MIDWLQKQPLAEIFSCLGDGHDGIWNLFAAIAPSVQRFEILDWYHLKEHLYNVGGFLRRLNRAEDLLWQGDVEQSIALFEGCKFKRAINFLDNVAQVVKHRCAYLNGYVYSPKYIYSVPI